MGEETIYSKLADIQQKLKAPKGQVNSFGGYKYRSCEDILEAVKPLIRGLSLCLSDEIIEVGGRVYVKATAVLRDGREYISAVAYARESDQKKGYDPAQITGASSSYARKYALNGLFCIDDTKDADFHHGGAKMKQFSEENPEAVEMAQRGAKIRQEAEERIKENPYEIANDTTPPAALSVNEKRKRITDVLIKMNQGDSDKAKADLKSIFKVEKTSDLTAKDLNDAYKRCQELAADGLAYEKEKEEQDG